MPRPGSKKRPTIHFEARSEEEKKEWGKLASEQDLPLTKWVGIQVRKSLGEVGIESPELEEARQTIEELRENLHASQARNEILERSHSIVDAELISVRARLYGPETDLVWTDLAQFFRTTLAREGQISRKELLQRIEGSFEHPQLLDRLQELERTFSSIGMIEVTNMGVLKWKDD